MKRKTRITPAYRILSLLVALTVIFGVLPIMAVSAAPATSTSVADPSTVEDWKTWFPKNSNVNSGGIFVDKTVYTASDAVKSSSYFYDIANKLSFGNDNFGNENFLVSLSAIGSNTEILGYSATPTDTMLVLDLSGSMAESYTVGYTSQNGQSTVTGYSSELIESMVDATNAAIKKLQELNKHNRVGVVFYSGNTSTAASSANTATVVLPLDRYTAVNDEFISAQLVNTTQNVWVSNGGYRRQQVSRTYVSKVGIDIASGLKTEGGKNVSSNYKQAIGGTYTQNGLYKAFNQFAKGDDTVIADNQIQGGTQRMPIVVLMSDGAPTTSTTTYNNIGTSNAGSGLTDDATSAVGFLTQLTAAWVKSNLKTNYNGKEPRFYTLGVGTQNSATATGVLNPSSAANNATNYWNTFLDNAQRVALTLPDTSSGNGTWSTYINHLDNSELSKNYVDKYWTANDAASMIAAFESIVEEIIIQSRYYATLVSSNQHELDGYISFTDEIGTFMEVKDIKGIHIGEGTLVTGDMFAKALIDGEFRNANGSLTELGVELIQALNSRFSISDDDAYQLLNNSVENGFIAYDSQTGKFSNYVAWYATKDNQYIQPYNQKAKGTHPENAQYIVKSYIYLGDVTQNHVETSMMYTLIRVKEDIATGRQVVDANLPAALLPMVTYTVEVNGNQLNDQTVVGMTSNVDDKAPACLLFEVGLRDDITPYNVSEKLKDYSYLKNNDGTYSLYTNRWTDSNNQPFAIPADDDLPENIFEHQSLLNTTVALFTPSVENERYYYTNSTTVLQKNGTSYTAYTGQKPTGSGYYHAYTYITTNGSVKLNTVYNPITANAMKSVESGDNNTWVIPAGTPKKYLGEDVHGEEYHTHKDTNDTNTLLWSYYPHPTYDASKGSQGYLLFNYLGNNGKITITSAQGIKLTKTVSQVVDGASNEFTFEVKLTGQNIATSYEYYIEKANGTTESGTAAVSTEGVLSVTIGADDVIYITGIEADTQYEVTEKYNKYYVGHSTNNIGVVAAHTLHPVDFVNTPKGYGSLLVEKDVAHPFGTESIPAALVAKKFNVTVAFEGSADDLANIVASAGITSADGNKTFNFTLSDGTDALFTNIPEGVKYTVTETNLPAGFTLQSIGNPTGTIEKNTQSSALIVNEYTPDPISPNVTVTGIKNITDYTWTAGEFEVAIQQVDIGGESSITIGNPVVIGTMKHDGKTYTFKMNEGANKITLDKVGNYSYMVYEVEPATNKVANIAYDKTFALFTLHVTDNDADGALEVSNLVVHRGSADLSGDAQNGWTVEKDFTNLYMAKTVTFDVQKAINGSTADHAHDSGILFGLFASKQDTNPLFYALTDNDGKASFGINVKQDDYKTAPVTYYLREVSPLLEDSVVGMTYDIAWKYTVTIYWPEGDDEPTVTFKTDAGADVNADQLFINNLYDGNVTTSVNLSGKKTLNGGNLRNGDSFTFELYQTTANFSVSGLTPLQTKVVTDANGAIVFDSVTFNTTGTKYLVVKEVTGNAGGIEYDQSQYHITLNVVKVKDSTDKIVLAVDNNSMHIHKTGHGDVSALDQINFNNIYTVNDIERVVIEGIKELPERTLVAGEFEFGLYEDGATAPKYTVKNSASGKFTFPELTFTEVGSHTYTVKEIEPAEKFGVTYVNTPQTITVTLTDDGNGGLNKEVLINGSATGKVKFTNHYAAQGTSLVLSGVKTLEGRELNADEFTFQLFKTNSTFEVADGATPINTDTNSVYASNKHKGDYSFTLQYNDGDEGTHYYVVSENIPTDRFGVSYDTREYNITVVVIDNGKGNIVATVSSVVCPGINGIFNATSLDFGNYYNSAPAELVVKGEKDYNITLTADLFEFQLLNENETVLATVKNDANGNFEFPVQYLGTEGEHIFYVTEVKGEPDSRITFDESKFKVVATVEDNKLGNLEIINLEYFVGNDTKNKIEFVNKYTPKPDDITVDFNIKKTVKILGSEKLGPDGFEFLLTYLTVPGSAKVKTDANGDAKFTLAFTEDDIGKTYNYKLTEVNGGKENVKYSTAEYNISVAITLDSNNKLQATVTVNNQAAETVVAAFENEYNYTPPAPTPPPAPQPEAPQTDDFFGIQLWLAALFVSGGGFIASFFASRKRKKEDAQ